MEELFNAQSEFCGWNSLSEWGQNNPGFFTVNMQGASLEAFNFQIAEVLCTEIGRRPGTVIVHWLSTAIVQRALGTAIVHWSLRQWSRIASDVTLLKVSMGESLKFYIEIEITFIVQNILCSSSLLSESITIFWGEKPSQSFLRWD